MKFILVALLLLSVCKVEVFLLDNSSVVTSNQFESNFNQFQYKMGSESEDLDKCFEVVSAVVQKAGDVLILIFFSFLLNWINH